MSVTKLSPTLLGNLIYANKATATSIARGDICVLSSGNIRPMASVTDGTSTYEVVIAEQTLASSCGQYSVRAQRADGETEYLVTLNTSTSVSLGDLFLPVSGEAQQLAKSGTVTDGRIAEATFGKGTAVTVARVRFLRPTITK